MTQYFQNRLLDAAEECKAILKYETKTSCMPKDSSKSSNKNKEGIPFLPKFTPKWILGSEFQKPKFGFGIGSSKILFRRIFRQKGQLLIFSTQICPKILGSDFPKSKSRVGIDSWKKPCVASFTQNGQLGIFQPKFRKVPQSRATLWFI